MLKIFKDTFKTTNEGIILTVPPILFLCLISLYINYSMEVVDTPAELLLASITMLFIISAFCAGWFYMVKECVAFSKKDFILDKDKASESSKLIQCFADGIGKYFLTYVGVSLIFFVVAILMAYVLYFLCSPFIKDVYSTLQSMNAAFNSTQELTNFVNNLSPAQLLALLKMELVWIGVTSIFAFSMMLWMPEILYTKKNPLISLFTSVVKVYSKFLKSLLIFIYIGMLNFLLSFLTPFVSVSPVTYIIVMSVYFYFIVYIVVLLFSYYDREFNNEQTKSE